MQAADAIQHSTPLAYTLDLSVAILLFAARVPLFIGILKLVSRREADVNLKKGTWATFLLIATYFLFNTTPEAVLSIRACLLVTLLGTVIGMKAFWVSLEHSFLSCLLFCCLSILLASTSHRGLDYLVPDRATIGRSLSQVIDARVRATAEDPTLPPSTGVMPAVLRLALTPGSNGFVDALLSPFRTAQTAKAQIADISRKKADEASIVNMLSGAGTNVLTRAAEMEALKAGLVAEASGVAPAPGPAGSAPAGFPAGTPVTQAKAIQQPASPATASVSSPAQAAAVAAPSPAALGAAIAAVTNLLAAHSAAPSGTNAAPAGLPPVKTTVIGTNTVSIQTAQSSVLDGMSAEERKQWEEARRLIRVSAMGWSKSGAYVMIGGHCVSAGATYSVIYQGGDYAFRFKGVTAQGACKWDPVPASKEPATDFIAF